MKTKERTLNFRCGPRYLTVQSSEVLEIEGIEHFSSSQLGLELVILPTGEVVDVASPTAYLIDEDRLDECEKTIIDWMDHEDTKTAADFRGEAKTDWDWIVRAVRKIA
jgi:ketopantoate reductase